MTSPSTPCQPSILPLTELHTHTVCSDGLLDAKALAEKARDFCVNVLAVTDHDNTDAVDDIRRYASAFEIETISGVEMTCCENGQEIHMLAYCFDVTDPGLQNLLTSIRLRRRDRCEVMLTKLEALGMKLTMDEVLEQVQGQSIVRPHLAAALVKKGFVESNEEAFNRLLHNNGPAYAAIPDLPLAAVIPVVHRAGGVAVLAHPSRSVTADQMIKFINEGLDGIEVFHPSHSRPATNNLRNFAKRYNILATGGSDFHGSRAYDDNNFGRFSVEFSVIEQMKCRALTQAKQAI